jgi:hypothetical protein
MQLPQDMKFQRREWAAQRVGIALMVLILIAGALGAFGDGPLSRSRQTDRGGHLTIRFERFARLQAAHSVRIEADPVLAVEGRVRIGIEASLLENQELRSITPAPLATEAGDAEHVFIYPVPASGARVSITLHLLPLRAGTIRGAVAVGEATVGVAQFVYP